MTTINSQPNARWWITDEDSDQGIIARYVIVAQIELVTPAHFGNGDVSAVVDMPLMRDSVDGRAVLTGSSIAGALRSYLREVYHGYEHEEGRYDRVAQLFGHNIPKEGKRRDEYAGVASLLTIDDAFSQKPTTELRDGVRLDPKTRTAADGALYNTELLTPGTTFDLRFELAIPHGKDGGRFKEEGDYQAEILTSLALALRGLDEGDIRLGKRKRRGFGQIQVNQWLVRRYNMSQPADLLAWLTRPTEGIACDASAGKPIVELLIKQNDKSALVKNSRSKFSINATFSLDESSLLIRSSGSDPDAPDMVHLTSNGKPIVSGTSLAGAIRARALRIANTLGLQPLIKIPSDEKDKEYEETPSIVLDMFGGTYLNQDKKDKKDKKQMKASRVIVDETEIKHGVANLVQNRVKIDRFTGGSYPGALFDQMPVWGQAETCLTLKLTLLNPQPAEIGLLLHVLKDLWTSDLPIGGESSVGRGRLQGHCAELVWQDGESAEPKTWVLKQVDNRLTIEGDRGVLEDFAKALQEANHAKTKETP